jgi:flagellar basal body-associated protein FliL
MEEKNIDVNVDEVDGLVNRYKTHKKKRRKVALIIVAAVLLLVIVVSLIVFFVNKMSYRSTVDDFMEAYIAKDSSAILDMSSSYYSAKKQYNISIVETVNYYNKIVTNAHANFKANLGDNYEISYEITSTDKMRNEEFESMIQSLTFGAYNPAKIITEALRVEITITAEAEASLTHVITLLLTNEEGEWRVLDIK